MHSAKAQRQSVSGRRLKVIFLYLVSLFIIACVLVIFLPIIKYLNPAFFSFL